MKRPLPLVLFLFLFGCATATPPAETGPVHVVIVHTTDVHGWFNGHVESPPGGGPGVVWGGLPTLASYIEALRDAHDGRVVVVDSGDIFQGTLESNLFEGAAMVRAYNRMGYAAAALGNHEFDFGPLGDDVVPRKPGDDPLGAIKRNAELAMFPFLAANMVEKESGKIPAWAKPYTIVRSGGARIGIIGLAKPDTPVVTLAVNVATLSFTDPVEATVRAARELREQKVDAIIVIGHMGGRCENQDDPHDASSCDEAEEAMQYVKALPPGTVDAYFGGHSHARMGHYINGIPTIQAMAVSREFATLDLWIDTENDKVTKSEIRPHTMICPAVYEGTLECDPRNAPAGKKLVPRTFSGRTIEPDTRVALAIEPYLRRVASKREEKLGITVAEPFPRNYGAESPIGNLIADALRSAFNADIGVMNSGGIRTELPAGNLVYADIFAVSPFDNFPALVTMTGKQIWDFLRLTATGPRGIMQVSGIRYVVDAARDKPDSVLSVTLENGQPIDPDETYRVVMPDFVAAGGDGTMEVMSEVGAENVQIFFARPLREVLIAELKKRREPLVPKTEGRITILNAPAR